MILVTGANGFLGKHLLAALSRQDLPVRALFRSHKPDLDFGAGVEWRTCDLLDISALAEAMQGVQQVYHCAATVSFDAQKQKALTEDNVTLTANVVNAALDASIQRFIHVSSVAALGRNIPADHHAGTLPIDEDSPWDTGRHKSMYAEGKYLAELEVWRGMAEGLNAAIVNPALILGEGNWERGSARLIRIVYDEFPWFTPGINAWVDVADVVKAMILLMNSEVCAERFILSCGNYAYKEVFTRMAAALHRRPPHRKAGKRMTELVWRIELLKSRLLGREATITRETARTAHMHTHYNNDKFLRTFPEFQYNTLSATIDRVAGAFLKDLGRLEQGI